MSDHIKKTIDDALAELRKQEAAVIATKSLINRLCEFAKMEPMFAETELKASTESGVRTSIKRNAFYGQPLATCVREFLTMRRNASGGSGGEATLDEIMAALREGSYDFSSISKDEDGQKRGVAISLAKNTTTFHRLPNGDFGLFSWYPNVKAKKEKPANDTQPNQAQAPSQNEEPTPTAPVGAQETTDTEEIAL